MANAPKLSYQLTTADQLPLVDGFATTEDRCERLQYLADLSNLTKEQVRLIVRTGFIDAPASFRYHSNFEGGLIYHTFMVSLRLRELIKLHDLESADFNIDKVALCHDLCKATYNRKQGSTWSYVPTALPGHAEASLQVAQEFGITFTHDELYAIRWHMGAYCLEKPDLDAYALANKQAHNLPFLTHTADMTASLFDEKSYPFTVQKDWN